MTGSRSGGTCRQLARLAHESSLRRTCPPYGRQPTVRPRCRRRAPPVGALRHALDSMAMSSRSDLFRRALAERVARRRRRHGHDAAGRRPHPGRLRGPRGLQRGPQRHPARHRPRRCTTPTSRWASTASRPTRSAPTSATWASTASSTGSTSWPRAGARIARRGRRRLVHPEQPRFVLGSVGPGHQAALAGARHLRRAARRLRRAGRRAWSTAARTPLLVETAQDLLQAKAAIIGREAGARGGRATTCRCSSRSPSRRPARCCSAARSAPR